MIVLDDFVGEIVRMIHSTLVHNCCCTQFYSGNMRLHEMCTKLVALRSRKSANPLMSMQCTRSRRSRSFRRFGCAVCAQGFLSAPDTQSTEYVCALSAQASGQCSYHAGAFVGVFIRKFNEQVSAGPRVEIRAAHVVHHDLVLVLANLHLDRGCPTQHNLLASSRRALIGILGYSRRLYSCRSISCQ